MPTWFFAVLLALVIVFSHAPTFAASQDLFIPEWFLNVYQYFKDEQISAREFEDAVAYLQKIKIVRLLEDSPDDPIANFEVTNSIIEQTQRGHAEFSNCSTHWYITGYFTPVESDYSGKFITVTVNGYPYKFKEDFLSEIKIEGWGKTLSGKYLGWYGDSFHLSDFPLDVTGSKLGLRAVAVDPVLIPPNSAITIPTLLPPWNDLVFVASDVGTSIVGKHIDVYTGEGKDARDETFRITGHDNIVCLEAR